MYRLVFQCGHAPSPKSSPGSEMAIYTQTGERAGNFPRKNGEAPATVGCVYITI